MINYQSRNPSKNFLMLENEAIEDLSPNAMFLYLHYRNLQSNQDNSNKTLMKLTSFKKTKFDAAKSELVSKGYLDTKQLFNNKYALYIGKESVQRYARSYKSSENRHVKHELKQLENSSLESQKN